MFGAASGKKLKATPNNASVNATSVGGAPLASQPHPTNFEKIEKEGTNTNGNNATSGNAMKTVEASGLP